MKAFLLLQHVVIDKITLDLMKELANQSFV